MQRAYRIGSKPVDCGMLAGKNTFGLENCVILRRKRKEKKNLFI